MRNRRYFHRRIRVDIDISSPSFDRSETRVIFIGEYVWKNKRSSSSFDCSKTRVSFIEEYVSTLIPVHPTSIAMKHALFSSKNTCGRIKEVHPAPIAVNTRYFLRRIRVNIEISSSSFDCSETRVILVEEYVWIIKISFPASIAVKRGGNYHINSRFHCNEARVIYIMGSVAVITVSYSRFHCNETRVIFITVYAAIITLVIPSAIALKPASFSTRDTLQ